MLYLNSRNRQEPGVHVPISGTELRAVLEEHVASAAFKSTVTRNIKNEASNYEMLLRQFVEKLAVQHDELSGVVRYMTVT